MTTKSHTDCGCCTGIAQSTPHNTANRPGLGELRYRIGTHASFMDSMQARLSSSNFPALEALKTRDLNDPSIALLDAWAVVADVLSFYNERLVTEGYLRTATLRRSVVEMAQLVGYSPRPGVSASTFLAYTLDDNAKDETLIPKGARAQSIPGPGELPQSFETSEDLYARKAWNNLQPRMTKPLNLTLNNILLEDKIYLAGTALNLKTNDHLLFIFGEKENEQIPRRIKTATPLFADNKTEIELVPEQSRNEAIELKTITVDSLISPLLTPASVQKRTSLHLSQKAEKVFKTNADAIPQLLVNLNPALATHFYDAWTNAKVKTATAPLQAIYVLRLTAPPFGYNAPTPMGLMSNPDDHSPVRFISVPTGVDWPMENKNLKEIYLDNSYEGITPGSYILIDTIESLSEQEIAKGKIPGKIQLLRRVDVVKNGPYTAYSLSGKSTHLTIDKEWRTDNARTIEILRHTLVRTQSERLYLAESPINTEVGDPKNEDIEDKIALAELYPGLQPGRWLIISGERTDIPGTSGIMQSELAMLANVEQIYDATLPGDKTLSTITLAKKLAYRYKRDSVKIYGNVVKATNGETRSETLGGGDASKSLQSFTLKQPPLTYVSASNPSGIDSTLKVYVNDVEWQEIDSLAGESARARRFTTKTDDEGKTTVIFGNGTEGSRLPTGQENIKARYRNGIGKAGNVKANQISLLMARPLGVKEVINPLKATGGTDKETINQARRHAPLAVKALDRLVSVKDYEDFSRMFGGIGKASAVELSDGQRRIVHITIAGEEDIPIDTSSDLYENLSQALLKAGDPFQPIKVDVRELILIVISAGIKILPSYLWEVVVTQVRNALLEKFSFEARELGQDVLLGEVIATIQAVPGVDYVDVDLLRGVPEKITTNGTRTLTSLTDISDIILGSPAATSGKTDADLVVKRPKNPQERLCVNLAGNKGGIYPAQLAFLTPAVPSTLILNQIP